MDPTSFYVCITAAALMGTVIGLERQLTQHPAGIKTHCLVSFGAALFVALPHLLGDASNTVAHVAGQVVTGVGFLAGGVILREGMNVKGMNTAATVWCSAAIGALSGAGLLTAAAAGTVGVLVLNMVLRPISDRLDRRLRVSQTIETMYHFRLECRAGKDQAARALLMQYFQSHRTMAIQGLATQDGATPDRVVVTADIYAERRDDCVIEELLAQLNADPDVVSVSWKRAPAS